MATLTTQRASRIGLQATYASAAAGGDSFTPGRNVFLHVKNASGVSVTVTVDTPRNVIDDVAMGNPQASVAAAQEEFIGPYPADVFAQADDGLADITYSAVTSVTIAVVELPQS